jgi:ATP-dependent RNA helicase RhlE
MPFSRLGLDAPLTKTVAMMGYTEPTPIQTEAIPPALEGRDVIGCAQTGTGKTAAFILPALQRMSDKRGIKTLVITPTRELADQIQKVAFACSKITRHRVTAIYGGVSYGPQEANLRRGMDMLVATPGRLLDLIQRRSVNLSQVEILVLDEADRMLDMGFWPDVKRIIGNVPKKRQTLLFSATISPKIMQTIGDTLSDPVSISIGRPATPVELIDQSVYPVAANQKIDLLIELLKQPEMERGLIFVKSKHRADRLARKLNSHGLATAPIHSGRSQAQRTRALADFKRGAHRFLLGTDVIARGIDVTDVTHVVNFDIPSNPEDYVHRIGRTARAGAKGTAISLLTCDDHGELRDIEKLIGHKLESQDMPGFRYNERPAPAAQPEKRRQQRRPQQHRRARMAVR